MPSAIATVEDAMIERAKRALGFPSAQVVKQVETLPGGWTLDMLRRALQAAPGVYIAFLGGQSTTSGGYVNARFAVYVVSKGVHEDERRRGNPREIGAYETAERLVVDLDGLDIADVGTLVLRAVENVFSEAMFELGGTVYALTFELPNLAFGMKSIDDLAPFVTFEADISMAAGTAEPAHQILVTLPQ